MFSKKIEEEKSMCKREQEEIIYIYITFSFIFLQQLELFISICVCLSYGTWVFSCTELMTCLFV